MARLGLKSFRHEGCVAYVVFDKAEKGATQDAERRPAAVIDPGFEIIDDLREFLMESGLRLQIVLETHTHADHFSASHVLRDELKAEIGMSHATRSERVTRKLKNGDRIELGGVKIRVLETPGHTPDSLCYEIEGERPVLFTGDTLLIGATGRVDFPGADASQMWDSLHDVLGKLPDTTLVLPGHDYNDLIFTTLGTERARNPQLRITDRARFAEVKAAEIVAPAGGEVEARVSFNLARSPAPPAGVSVGEITKCGVSVEGVGGAAGSINVEKYGAKLEKRSPDHAYVDVREEYEFAEGHPEGSRNVPLSEVGLHLQEMMDAKRVYFSCLSGRRSLMAARTLSYVGHPDVVNVNGGFKAWVQAGLPVKK